MIPLYYVLLLLFVIKHSESRSSQSWKICDSTTEFFETVKGECTSCTNYIVNPTVADDEVRVSNSDNVDAYGNALSCKCPDGTVQVEESCTSTYSVSQFTPCSNVVCRNLCAGSEVPSSDATSCIPCGSTVLSAEYVALGGGKYAEPVFSSGQCTCSDGYVLVDRDNAGNPLGFYVCNACPSGTKKSNNICESCSDINAEYSGSTCVCKTGFEISGVSSIGDRRCLRSEKIDFVNSLSSVIQVSKLKYLDFMGLMTSNTISVDSLTYQHYYLTAASQCALPESASDLQGCHCLANLCAMQLFSLDAPVCDIYNRIYQGRVGQKIKEMYDELPGIGVLSNANVNIKLGTRDTTNQRKEVRLAVAKYGLDGEWKGYEDLMSQLWYCGVSMPESISKYWLYLGASMQSEYDCNITWLATQNPETFFYDPYVVEDGSDLPVSGSSSTSSLYPVPVRYINYRKSGLIGEFAIVNANDRYKKQSTASRDDVYTTRFFTHDAVGGIEAAGSSVPVVVKFLEYVQIEFRVFDDESTSDLHMYPPLISVRYRDVQLPLPVGEDTRRVTVHVAWSRDSEALRSTWSTAKLLFGFSVFFWIAYATAKMINEDRRLPYHSTEISKFFRIILYSFTTMTRCGMPILCAFTWFYLFFFKWAADFHSLPLPWDYRRNTEFTAHPQQSFISMFVCLLAGSYFRVGEILYRQCVALDIFFVDWEKSKNRRQSDKRGKKKWPVSVWRTIKVANEWMKLQTSRRASFEVTLMSVLFLFVGCDVRRYAITIPEVYGSTGSEGGYEHPYLIFANISFWWLFVVFVQRLLRFLVYERFFAERRVTRFLDLCALTKVSVLILDETFHGYYIHGRSSHSHADVSMVELTTQMKCEERGEVAGRGLVTHNSSGGEKSSIISSCRSFEVFVSEAWREHFNSIYWSLFESKIGHEGVASKHHMQATAAALMSRVKKTNILTSAPEDVLAAHKVLLKFLKLFLGNDKSNKHVNEFGYSVQIRDMCHRIVGLSPSLYGKSYSIMRSNPSNNNNKDQDCTFVCDDDITRKPFAYASFERVLFYGVEVDIVLFDMMNFCGWYFVSGNYVLSAFLTWLLDSLLCYARTKFSKHNVAHKSLLDERFLSV